MMPFGVVHYTVCVKFVRPDQVVVHRVAGDGSVVEKVVNERDHTVAVVFAVYLDQYTVEIRTLGWVGRTGVEILERITLKIESYHLPLIQHKGLIDFALCGPGTTKCAVL